MHKLGREIRFSIDPFRQTQQTGYNSYASKPIGSDRLCFYLSLWVELSSQIDPDTGFVVNVTEIDRSVRQTAVPYIAEQIRTSCASAGLPTLQTLGKMLQYCWKTLTPQFPGKRIIRLTLNLNPYRSICIQSEDSMELYYSEKFEFSAMHQLWNDQFDDAKNYEMFGKCANPAGHGHNYILEVKVRPAESGDDNWIQEYQKVIKGEFLDSVDHKNLNVEVQGLENRNPTVENLARFAWETLVEKFRHCKLSSITIWENDRTYCTFTG